MKLHPQVAVSHVHLVNQILYITIGSVFGANVSPHNWEAFVQSCCKKSEHLQSSLEFPAIAQKHSALIDLTKLPKDTEKCPHLLVKVIADRISKGIVADGKQGTAQSAILVDDSFLSDIWEQLKLTLACRIESLRVLIGEPHRKSAKAHCPWTNASKPQIPTSTRS